MFPEPFDRTGVSSPIGRFELIAAAGRLGWPRYNYRGAEVVGESQWKECPFVYAADRRAAFEYLRAIEKQR